MGFPRRSAEAEAEAPPLPPRHSVDRSGLIRKQRLSRSTDHAPWDLLLCHECLRLADAAGQPLRLYRRCLNCTRHATYGLTHAATGKPLRLHCWNHREPNEKSFFFKKCAVPECEKQPSFGAMNTAVALFCKAHKLADHVNVRDEQCQHPGCSRSASFGEANSRKRIFCGKHRTRHVLKRGALTDDRFYLSDSSSSGTLTLGFREPPLALQAAPMPHQKDGPVWRGLEPAPVAAAVRASDAVALTEVPLMPSRGQRCL